MQVRGRAGYAHTVRRSESHPKMLRVSILLFVEGGVDVRSPALQDARVGLETRDADRVLSAYHDEFLFEDVPSSQRIANKADLRSYFESLLALPDVAFSDIRIRETQTFATIEWTWSGTVPSTGSPYRVLGASVIELRDGKIASETLYYDPRPTLA